MIEARTKPIGSSTYQVTQLGATQALNMLTELIKMVGPSLGVLIDGVKGESKSFGDVLNAQVGGDVFGRATEALASRLDSSKVQELISKLREKSQVDRDGSGNFQALGPIYEVHFAGNLGELFGWLRFALEVNFSDFLPLLAGLGRQGSTGVAARLAP